MEMETDELRLLERQMKDEIRETADQLRSEFSYKLEDSKKAADSELNQAVYAMELRLQSFIASQMESLREGIKLDMRYGRM